MVPCLETGLALVWSVHMTSEDPIPLDQDPMQSWIGVAHSGGYVLLIPGVCSNSLYTSPTPDCSNKRMVSRSSGVLGMTVPGVAPE